MRAAARAMMPDYIRRGYSATRFRSHLRREFGKAYRWQTLLNDWRQLQGLVKWQRQVEAVKPNQQIPRAFMSEADLRLDRRYRLHGYETYLDPETGEEVRKRISWYTNSSLDKEGFEDEYFADRQRSEIYKGLEVINIEVVGVEHNRTWGY